MVISTSRAKPISLGTQKRSAQTKTKEQKRTRCEVWTRVMGYHRPVSQFNKGKKSEHAERNHFQQKVTTASSHASK
ncbi:MAG TPA: hypothetical protein ENI70_01265 [Candidatus Peregrinibacteria bacterium]|nr:hypothetical protein [Candidatus Peregrinibacteria bacterium]